MRVVLDDGSGVRMDQLVVGAVDELLVVGVMLDHPLAIDVVDGQAFGLLVRVHHITTVHVVGREMIRLIPSLRVVGVAMARLDLALHHLHLFRLYDVHAEHIFEVLSAFTGLKCVITGSCSI